MKMPRHTSMQSYIVQSKMQFPGEWATDLEITAASCFLNTKYSCIQLYWTERSMSAWALYSPHEVMNDLHQEESIVITNVQNHFEVVKKM